MAITLGVQRIFALLTVYSVGLGLARLLEEGLERFRDVDHAYQNSIRTDMKLSNFL